MYEEVLSHSRQRRGRLRSCPARFRLATTVGAGCAGAFLGGERLMVVGRGTHGLEASTTGAAAVTATHKAARHWLDRSCTLLFDPSVCTHLGLCVAPSAQN